MSDGRLLEAIREDSAEAFQDLIARHWDGVARYAFRMLGREEEAKDVAQEVFVRIWQFRARWKPGGAARAYLYTVARNLIVPRLRHQEVRSRTAAEVERRVTRTPSPAEAAVHGELQDALEIALRELPSQRREAFLLVRFEGLSHEAVARIMGLTKRTVANHVYLATKDLEQSLRPFLE